MLRSRWAWVLAAGLAAAGAVAVAPVLARGVIVQVVGWGCVLLVLVATRPWPDRERRVWWTLAGAGALFLVGNVVLGVVDDPRRLSGLSGVGNGLLAAGFVVIISACTVMYRRRRGEDDRADNTIDALIVACGIGVLVWAAVMTPYLGDLTIALPVRAMNVVFSGLAIALLAATLRVAVAPGARNPSYYLLAGCVGLLFVTDILATLASTGADTLVVLEVISPLIFVLFAAGVLHPSSGELVLPAAGDEDGGLTVWRIALLAAALLIPAGVLVANLLVQTSVDLPVVAGGTVLLSALVLTRLTRLVRDREQHASREHVLRRAGTVLVGATERDEMYEGALVAALELAERDARCRSAILLGDELEVEVAATAGHETAPPLGARLRLQSLPTPVRRALRERRSARIPPGTPDVVPTIATASREGTTVVAPLASRHQFRGLLVLSAETALGLEVQHGVEALAAELALALESSELRDGLARQRTERRFRALVEASSDLVMVVGETGRVSFATPSSERLLGRDDESLLGREPFELVHVEDQMAAHALLERARAGDTSEIAQALRFLHSDGSYRWFEVIARDRRDDPEIGGTVVNAREVTDRKAAEQRLARSEARFRALVQNSSDIVAVIDTSAVFSYMSPAVTRVLGYTPDELLGTSVFSVLERGEVATAFRLYDQLSGARFGQSKLEIPILDRSGAWRTLDVTLTDLRHEPAVRGIVLNARDITDRKALENDLRRQALSDALTGLGNRSMFSDRVTAALDIRTEMERVVAVLLVDLDDFKVVNDSLGHVAGDELLVLVSQRLQSCLREQDVAARLGGDEFAVLLEAAADEPEAKAVAERIVAELADPFTVFGRPIVLSASIGVAIAHEGARSAEVLLRNADMAMYLAKRRGRGRVELFEEAMHARMFEQLELKTDLAYAIEHGQLAVHYQPVVNLTSGMVTGVEALVRWNHPDRGLLGAPAFVPLAEETGLIVPLGRRVLVDACAQYRAWRRAFPGVGATGLHVNVSVRQLQHDEVIADLATVLRESELEPSDLTLEITESMLLDDTDAIRHRLDEIRALGVSLAIDDFGTGYSSLSYLQHFPIDTIKVDRVFVEGLGDRPGDEGVVQTIIELARARGIRTIAEGIEGAAQLEVLKSLGCEYGQGFYFYRPMPAEEMEQILEAGREGIVASEDRAAGGPSKRIPR